MATSRGAYIDYSIIGFNRLFHQTATKRKKQPIKVVLNERNIRK